ncbi:hypothetical protein BN1723_004111 [Verticillium longisporum]|uniref:Uncharacterized protein n=1 Tax=Verticillium longisporum TaxID=100787 RepID=A0A0G4MM88_VERLO|nr:hypothetical protein BN1723_004111 [Verticillium longisporum]
MAQQGIPNADSVASVGDSIPMVTLPSHLTANASPSDASQNTSGATMHPSAISQASPTGGSPADVSPNAPQGPNQTPPLADSSDAALDPAWIASPPSPATSPTPAVPPAVQSPATPGPPQTTVPQPASQTPAPQPTPHSLPSSTHGQPQTAPASSPSTPTTLHPPNTATPPVLPVASPPSSPTTSITPVAPTQLPGILTGTPLTPNGAPIPSNVPTKASPIHAALTDGLLWSALWAMLLFMFVSLLTWQAKSLDWPLANLSISSGIFLLTILAKLTDWALDSLGNLGWEKLYWGPILHRNATLLTHLVMNSGLAGWWVVLRNPPKNGSPSPSRIVNLLRRGLSARWPQFWAFWRIAVWLLIQFPGIIIMSDASPRTSYRPAGWSTVSGGMGIFNSSDTFQVPGDYVTNSYIFNMLQDTRMASSTEAISHACRNDLTCEATLLVGGLRWIAPWPYIQLPSDLTAFLTRDMPVYQLEGRNTTLDKSISWAISECRVYQAVDSAIQICAKESNKGGSILTGNSTISRYCETGQVRSDVTLNLWMFVYYNYQSEGFENSIAVDTLRNIYATALFLYNPVFRGAVFAPNTPAFLRTAQQGLADENYFPGTPARRSSHLAPAPWTVLAFTVSVGFLISASLLAIFFALWFKQPQLSAFGPLNAFKADLVQFGQAASLDLDALVTGMTDKEVALAADGIRVRPR